MRSEDESTSLIQDGWPESVRRALSHSWRYYVRESKSIRWIVFVLPAILVITRSSTFG
jgi:hypothetical protein